MQPKVSRRSLLAGGALTLNPALPARTAAPKPAPHKLKVDIVDTQTPFAEDILKTMASLNSRYQACAMYHTHSGAGVVGASIWDLYVLLKHFDPNAVGANYDVGHATIEGGLGGWIDSFGITEPHLRGIAVKDFIWAKDAGGNWQAHAISGNCAHIWPRPTYSGTDAFVCQPGDHPRHRMRRFTHKPSYLEPRHILGLQRVRGIFRPFLAPRHPATVLLAIQSNRRMLQFLLPAVLAAVAFAADPLFELSGQLLPPRRASVSIFATRSPFTATAQCDAAGRFTFKNLQPDDYTVAVFIAGRGEARRTVEVSPAAAGSHRRVSLTLGLKDSDFESAGPVPQHSVSVNQLAIPNAALRQYQQAQKDLERRNPDAAAKRLQNAVEIAPQFAMAWNELGTIDRK